MIGQTFSHYKILEKLGGGGMGIVYKARDLKLERDVALKFLPPEFLRDDDAKQRFIQEAQAASALEHPNICTIYEIDETPDGQMYIAMAAYDGETLKHRLDRGPLPIDEALDIATQIAQGLERAHAADIVHRDIKPANIMLTKHAGVKILDFGLAKVAGELHLTKEGSTLGTAAYMSPEQAQGLDLDHRTDLFSVGVLLYEMLAGQRPFAGGYEQAIIYSILNEEPAALGSARSDVPVEIEAIVEKCLQKRVEARYQSARELLADLKPDRTGPKSASLSTSRTARPAGSSRFRTAGFAAMVLAASAIGYWWLGREPEVKERIPVAVADFINQTGEPELDGLSGLLITSLEQSRHLSVLTRSRMFDILKQMGRGDVERIDESLGREICKRADLGALVTATVSKFGKLYAIDLKVYDTRREIHLVKAREQAEGQESVLGILDKLSEKTRAGLREKREEIQIASRPVAEVTTSNLEAYKHLFEGEKLYSKLFFREAAAEFSKAIAIDSTFALAHYWLARTYSWSWGYGGWANLSVAAARRKQSELLEKIPDFDRLPPKIRYMARAMHATAAHGGEAIQDSASLAILKEMEREYPDDKTLLFELGDAYYHLRNNRLAVRYFERVLELDPDFAAAYRHLPDAYRRTGELEKAIEAAGQLALQNRRAGLLELAEVYIHGKQDYDGALVEIKKALLIDPDDTRALGLALTCYFNIGKQVEAKVYTEKLRAAVLDNPSADQDPTLYVNLGKAYRGLGDDEEARRVFTHGINLFPDNVSLLSELSLVHRKLGNYDKSIEFGKMANEQDAQFNSLLGFLYFIKEDHQTAARYFQIGIEKEETGAIPRVWLVLALRASGAPAQMVQDALARTRAVDETGSYVHAGAFLRGELDESALLDSVRHEGAQGEATAHYIFAMDHLLQVRSGRQPTKEDTLTSVSWLEKLVATENLEWGRVVHARELLKRIGGPSE